MGYITYPRTSGSGKDIKRAEYILLLIEQLLQKFNRGDLNLILSLISLIGWANLPAALRARLLQLLYYDLFTTVTNQTTDDGNPDIDLIQPFTKSLVDTALQLSDLSGLPELPLAQRINAMQQGLVSYKQVTYASGYEQEMLVFDNGIHAILTTRASSERYINNTQKEIRSAARLYDAHTLQAIKKAHKKGMLVTINLLSSYIVNHHDGDSSEDCISYNFKNISKGMLLHRGIRHAVLNSIDPYLYVNCQQNTQPILDDKAVGYKQAYIVCSAYFLHRLKQINQVDNSQSNDFKSRDFKSNDFSNWSFWVEDSQTRGTECRFLTIQITNIARQFKAQNYEATILEWLDKIEMVLFVFFTKARIKRQGNNQLRQHSKQEAKLIAASIRQELQQHLISLDIPMTRTLSNQLARLDMLTKLPDLQSTEDGYVNF
ncbi:hypothetical protein [Psychrobacter sp. I-STPA10]|uniref:hypothetical protein n=1 Tax=Psychrobacter sp. I-STPA10 TaxID=2585769 RepID=UPI001E32DE98|nr:hypothetical protein [Psychrobacter sp. I-STPA10]